MVIVYLNEHQDAEETKQYVEKEGVKCLLIAGDIGDEAFCNDVVMQASQAFPSIDILVNNAAEQHVQPSIEKITSHQLIRTFQTNIFSMFYLTKAVLPHLKKGSSIINTASITAYKGNKTLIDYSATKGAIVTFTRSLSQSLVQQGIRVNAVAPAPFGHRLSRPALRQRMWKCLVQTCRWNARDSRWKWRQAIYTLPVTIPPMSQDRRFMSMAEQL